MIVVPRVIDANWEKLICSEFVNRFRQSPSSAKHQEHRGTGLIQEFRRAMM